MHDRKITELAAKAVGIKVEWETFHGVHWIALGQGFPIKPWDPLSHDGDDFCLAVSLGLEVSYRHDLGKALAVVPGGSRGRGEYWQTGNPVEATRRAIVRAAAAIQQTQEPPCSSTS